MRTHNRKLDCETQASVIAQRGALCTAGDNELELKGW